eukprot:m.31055 g.31055  ORF g.31055 m.31055 type:complete len:71 (-) comp41550_c1_seq1:747-959(-)
MCLIHEQSAPFVFCALTTAAKARASFSRFVTFLLLANCSSFCHPSALLLLVGGGGYCLFVCVSSAGFTDD